jgi:hypothetical protein
MDLNVKLHVLKYNFGKVQGCFWKITRRQEFLELMNYFSLGNSVQKVYGP